MSTRSLMKSTPSMPVLFDDFFKPWNEWFDEGSLWGRTLTVPAVNIKEDKDNFLVSLAAPGMKKDDFQIDMEGNMLSISCEKEESKEEKEVKFNRKEYNYTSFCRSFTIPEDVNKEKIEAKYEDGVLKMVLPKKEEVRKSLLSKHIQIK